MSRPGLKTHYDAINKKSVYRAFVALVLVAANVTKNDWHQMHAFCEPAKPASRNAMITRVTFYSFTSSEMLKEFEDYKCRQ